MTSLYQLLILFVILSLDCHPLFWSSGEQAVFTQHEMPLMKDWSAQMHLTSRLQLFGNELVAQPF